MPRYIAITFAPIQSFIEKSRKLRDLYGSSFILSFLAKAICHSAEKYNPNCVIVPANTSFTRGVANVIYLYLATDEPETLEAQLTTAFDRAWKALVDNCREYIEEQCGASFPPTRTAENSWNREWNLWAKHTWELFITCGAEGESLEAVRTKMADRKQSRDWIGLNWRGESSTISGTDAIAYPTMTSFSPQPKHSYEHSISEADLRIKNFFIALSEQLPESAIEPNERLSIPELIKRLITYRVVVDRLCNHYSELPTVEYPDKFTKLQLKESSYWKGWFQGDGDRMGVYIDKVLTRKSDPAEQQNTALQQFSEDMLDWGEALQDVADNTLGNRLKGRIVYAGGDDFFGVLYRDDNLLTPQDCLEQWWYGFKDIWKTCKHEKITVSTGFVWAAPNVPQRDLLQHLRQTEKAAKTAGKDRLAIRILFNSGNHLDWSCPWQHLQTLLESYQDRSGGKNWTHIYNDIAILEARHAFNDDSDRSIAEGILDIYFKAFPLSTVELWNSPTSDSDEDAPYQTLQGGLIGQRINMCKALTLQGGVLGQCPKAINQQQAENKRFNQWVIDLAKIGFHLFPEHQ
jgi:CRISPR-associated protein Cmr2